MIKNALPSLRQRAGPQRICSRQKSIRSGTARDSFSQTPHMRGKVTFASALHKGHGIIPAHAGKRAAVSLWWASPSDHPRVCGEKGLSIAGQAKNLGSPPHVRGKGFPPKQAVSTARITPAYAGKSALRCCRGRCRWDHPRTCGEKWTVAEGLVYDMGSPPHMRGKGQQSIVDRQTSRITPAHAGKRVRKCDRFFITQDHPRTCGEKSSAAFNSDWSLGSPPHMRGKARG